MPFPADCSRSAAESWSYLADRIRRRKPKFSPDRSTGRSWLIRFISSFVNARHRNCRQQFRSANAANRRPRDLQSGNAEPLDGSTAYRLSGRISRSMGSRLSEFRACQSSRQRQIGRRPFFIITARRNEQKTKSDKVVTKRFKNASSAFSLTTSKAERAKVEGFCSLFLNAVANRSTSFRRNLRV